MYGHGMKGRLIETFSQVNCMRRPDTALRERPRTKVDDLENR